MTSESGPLYPVDELAAASIRTARLKHYRAISEYFQNIFAQCLVVYVPADVLFLQNVLQSAEFIRSQMMNGKSIHIREE